MYQLGITFLYVRLPAILIHQLYKEVINYHNWGVGFYYVHFTTNARTQC